MSHRVEHRQRSMRGRELIVNADDFGASDATNAGIIRAHERGVVTSASLMVRRPAAPAPAAYARRRHQLGVGLHLDLSRWSHRDGMLVLVRDDAPVEREIEAQLERFRELVGRDPTHLDSHHHIHRAERIGALLGRCGKRLGVPVRERSTIAYCGGFYGQTDEGRPRPAAISPDALIALIEALPEGVTEIGCHPGLDAELESSYRLERLEEVEALCDPRVLDTIIGAGIMLRSFVPDERPPSGS